MSSDADAVTVVPLAYAGEAGGSPGLARAVGWIAVVQAGALLASGTAEFVTAAQSGWGLIRLRGMGNVAELAAFVGAVLVPPGLILAGGLAAAGRRPRGRVLLVVAELLWAAVRVVLQGMMTWQMWEMMGARGGAWAGTFAVRSAAESLQSFVLPIAVVVLLGRPEVRAAFGGRAAASVD